MRLSHILRMFSCSGAMKGIVQCELEYIKLRIHRHSVMHWCSGVSDPERMNGTAHSPSPPPTRKRPPRPNPRRWRGHALSHAQRSGQDVTRLHGAPTQRAGLSLNYPHPGAPWPERPPGVAAAPDRRYRGTPRRPEPALRQARSFGARAMTANFNPPETLGNAYDPRPAGLIDAT